MKVAVIGGTGFVGSHLVTLLEQHGHEVSLLVRPGSENKVPPGDHFRVTSGDVEAGGALDAALGGCAAVIYSVGILREVPKRGVTFEALQFDGVVRTVEAARRSGIRRFLLMSANGTKIPGTPYQETKKRAEDHVLASGLDATVFCPSVIFGDPGGRMEIATQLYRDMVDVPYPAIGFFTGLNPWKGDVLMSPVCVEDVATAFLVALSDDSTIGETIPVGGPEVLSWSEMIRRVARAVERDKWILPYPISVMKAAAWLFDWLPFFPVTRDQLTMLAEGNTAASKPLESLIQRPAIPFAAENLTYVRGPVTNPSTC